MLIVSWYRHPNIFFFTSIALYKVQTKMKGVQKSPLLLPPGSTEALKPHSHPNLDLKDSMSIHLAIIDTIYTEYHFLSCVFKATYHFESALKVKLDS